MSFVVLNAVFVWLGFGFICAAGGYLAERLNWVEAANLLFLWPWIAFISVVSAAAGYDLRDWP
jgi:hypothetical protein